MTVIVPNNVEVTDTALLWITGGNTEKLKKYKHNLCKRKQQP